MWRQRYPDRSSRALAVIDRLVFGHELNTVGVQPHLVRGCEALRHEFGVCLIHASLGSAPEHALVEVVKHEGGEGPLQVLVLARAIAAKMFAGPNIQRKFSFH